MLLNYNNEASDITDCNNNINNNIRLLPLSFVNKYNDGYISPIINIKNYSRKMNLKYNSN